MPARTSLAFAAAALLGFAGLGPGCATPVDVQYDERRDFSDYSSWDWLPGRAIVINAPFEDEDEIRALLARSIERALAPRGLQRAPGGGEIHVGATFTAVRDLEYFERTGAVETLTSHHEMSYEAQAVHLDVRVVDRCQVGLYMSERQDGRLIWQATVQDRFVGGCAQRLRDVVGRLATRFPPPR